MKRLLNILTILFLVVWAGAAHAAPGKFIVDGTNNGQWTDLEIKGGYTTTTRSGLKATIDLMHIAQNSTGVADPALSVIQAGVTSPLLGATCTSGGASGVLNTCGCYTSVFSHKIGSIKVNVNGTDTYLRTYDAPN